MASKKTKNVKKTKDILETAFGWDAPKKMMALDLPNTSVIPLSDDNAIFIKDSQYMQDMVGKRKTINKKTNKEK